MSTLNTPTLKPTRYVYEYMNGKHGYIDRLKQNFWRDTHFGIEANARRWINSKNTEERRTTHP